MEAMNGPRGLRNPLPQQQQQQRQTLRKNPVQQQPQSHAQVVKQCFATPGGSTDSLTAAENNRGSGNSLLREIMLDLRFRESIDTNGEGPVMQHDAHALTPPLKPSLQQQMSTNSVLSCAELSGSPPRASLPNRSYSSASGPSSPVRSAPQTAHVSTPSSRASTMPRRILSDGARLDVDVDVDVDVDMSTMQRDADDDEEELADEFFEFSQPRSHEYVNVSDLLAARRRSSTIAEAVGTGLSPAFLHYLNSGSGAPTAEDEPSQTSPVRKARRVSTKEEMESELLDDTEDILARLEQELSTSTTLPPEQPTTTASLPSSTAATNTNTSTSPRRKRSVIVQLHSILERSASVDSKRKSHHDVSNFDLEAHNKELRHYRRELTEKTERNFRIEQRLAKLDEQISVLLLHRITVEEIDPKLLDYTYKLHEAKLMSEKTAHLYGNLFQLLQDEPKYLAMVSRQLSMFEIDDILQTVMFTVFGNYELREEHHLLTMFESALKMEFDSIPELSNVMRSNTCMSRMMTTYTRRGLGQQYLKDTLSTHIQVVYELGDYSLEIDPLKVYRELKAEDPSLPPISTAEDALHNEQVRELIEERGVCLQEITDRFLSTIITNVDSVPYGIRWLCKTIRTLTQKKCPDASPDNVASLVGGFFLLRYVNPAIISPEAFNIVHDKPASTVRHNLTLIAKLIQTLANSSVATREEFAVTLSTYIEGMQVVLRDFLFKLSAVPDFYDEYSLETITALTQMDRRLSITPNEIYTIHKALHKYKNNISLQRDDRLLGILRELGDPPSLLSKKDNCIIELELISRWEPPVCSTPTRPAAPEHIDHQRIQHMIRELDLMRNSCEGMDDNFKVLTEKLQAYQSYLENVRGQAVAGSTLRTEFPSILIAPGSPKSPKKVTAGALPKGLGPIGLKLAKLDKEGVVLFSSESIPKLGDPARGQILVTFSMPKIGHVIFSVRNKGREAMYHKECKFEDILEMVHEDEPHINLGELLTLDARKLLVLLDRGLFRS